MPGETAHRLGFAVKVLGEGGLPSHDTRRWASGPHLRHSLEHLRAILEYVARHDIRMYRLPTALAPYASHPDLPQFHDQVAECEPELARLGARARELDVRLSMHTGPYVVLNSERPEVRAAAAAELDWQAHVLDALGCGPEAVVVVHVGGFGGGREAAAARFEQGVEGLSERARRRIALENDDRTWPLASVLEVAQRIGRPVVFDVMHHRIVNPAGVPEAEALRLALATWPAAIVPKIHFSSPKTQGEARESGGWSLPRLVAHADLIDLLDFEAFLAGPAAGLAFDVLLEARLKDVALLHLRNGLIARGRWPVPAP